MHTLGNISIAFQAMTSPHRLFTRLQRTSWYEAMLDEWVDALAVEPAATLLEIGCGPGAFSQRLAQRSLRVTGVDYSSAMIDAARRQESVGLDLAFERGDACALEHADDTFDYTIAASLINVVDNPVRALQEMQRVTAPSGTLSVLVPSDSMTSDAADRFVRVNNLRGFANSALRTWASMAPKMSAGRLTALFERAGLPRPEIHSQLSGMVVTATLRRS